MPIYFSTTPLDSTAGLKVRPKVDGQNISFVRFYQLLANDATACSGLSNFLRECEWPAFYWETPGVSSASSNRPFEFVVLDAPPLTRVQPDPVAFASHFKDRTDDAVSFPNLSGDAMLIAPTPASGGLMFPHLAAFLRKAGEEQIHRFWICVAQAFQQRLGLKPLWLSTAGLGISWLHLRVDSRPKYYRYAPYAAAT